MKSKFFLFLLILSPLTHAFAQEVAPSSWIQIQHNTPNLVAHFQIRPKMPFHKKGASRILLKLENESSESIDLTVVLHLSNAEMISDNAIYTAKIVLKANQKRIGRREGVVFSPKNYKPKMVSEEIHFEIKSKE